MKKQNIENIVLIIAIIILVLFTIVILPKTLKFNKKDLQTEENSTKNIPTAYNCSYNKENEEFLEYGTVIFSLNNGNLNLVEKNITYQFLDSSSASKYVLTLNKNYTIQNNIVIVKESGNNFSEYPTDYEKLKDYLKKNNYLCTINYE